MKTTYKFEYVVCPWCEGESGHRIDHLYDIHFPVPFGPWLCNLCGASFSGSVLSPGDVSLRKVESDLALARSMILLKLDAKDGTVFFVIDRDRLFDVPDDSYEIIQSSQRYFFEEHSCPTNWLRDCAAVIYNGDPDPHGFLKFVRSVDVPRDFDDDYGGQWPLLFPEAFEGDIIDGESTKVDDALRITKLTT